MHDTVVNNSNSILQLSVSSPEHAEQRNDQKAMSSYEYFSSSTQKALSTQAVELLSKTTAYSLPKQSNEMKICRTSKCTIAENALLQEKNKNQQKYYATAKGKPTRASLL